MKSDNLRDLSNIAVIRYGGLGDTLTLIPALNLIKQNYPQIRITVFINNKYSQLLRKFADSVENYEFAKFSENALNSFDFIVCITATGNSGLRQFFNSFDAANGFINRLNFIFIDECRISIYKFLINKFAEIFQFKTETTDSLAIDYFAESHKYAKYNNRILLHPGSGGKRKNPTTAELSKILQERALTPANTDILIGDAERDNPELLELFDGYDCISDITDYIELAGIIKSHKYFIGCDSGVSHLAGLCGVQGIVYFKFPNFEIWRPFNHAIEVVFL